VLPFELLSSADIVHVKVTSERAAAREVNYAPDAVEERARGIGEYMVAAPRLE
jgi:hypothetical protein